MTYDPKLTWARRYLAEKPIEINQAEREELLRIPGIGPKGAAAILQIRRQQTIRDLSVLKKFGIRTQEAKEYILMDGKQAPKQLRLFTF